MKEKGIIKLIKLLNEYIGDGQERLYACYPLDEDFDKFFHTKDGEGIIEEAQVISKKFGFIEWLWHNDKIDFDKAMKLGIPCFVRYDKGKIISVHDVDFYKQLLMLLSISDTPIEDLISYLK